MTDERKRLIIMGRVIGTYIGWDGDDESMVFYQFEPAENVTELHNVAPGIDDIAVHFTMGFFVWYDENGIPIVQRDVISIIAGLPQCGEAQDWQP